MKTLRVTRIFDPAKLHGELLTGGLTVLTVRSGSPDIGGPAVYGVAVFDDKTDLKKAQAVIKAHKETRRPSRQPDPEAMEQALREMEKL